MERTEYRALSRAEVLAELSRPQPTLILFHARPDGDAVGSAFALSLWLGKRGSPAYCLCADEVPSRLRFLIEGLQKSVLATSVPVSFEHARVITVDSASPAQLGSLYELYGARISLMIDHHAKGTVYADHWIEHKAATGEMIYDLIAESGDGISKECASLIYAAISTDTGGFRYSNTTPETHLRAAALLEGGVDAADLNHRLLELKSYRLLLSEKLALERLHLVREGRVAIITFPYALKQKHALLDEHLETLVDVARSLEGVEIAVAIRQPSEAPVFRASMRASVDFDVSAVCADFGGGGHPRAAGATLSGFESIEAAEDAVRSAICARLDKKVQ